jgi:hypothetical protein
MPYLDPNAIISETKLTQYLLVFLPKDDKSQYLALGGYTLGARNMKFKLFSQVYLTEDIPEYGLKKGSIGTIVEYYPI